MKNLITVGFTRQLDDLLEVIDEETYNLQIKSRAGIDILFGDNDIPNIGPLLDPWMEQERIDKLYNMNRDKLKKLISVIHSNSIFHFKV